MKKILLIAALFVLLIGCATEQTETQDKFVVGAVLPLTGPVAETGEDFHQGMQLAIEEIKPDIQFEIQDSKSNPKDGVTATQQILSREPDVLISILSAVSVPVSQLAAEHELPTVVALVVANDFAESSPYTFRYFTNARKDALKATKFLEEADENPDVAILSVENPYGESAKQQFKELYKGDIVAEETFELAEADFGTQLLKIKDSTAEWIYLLGYPAHDAQAFDKKKQLDMEHIVMGNSALTAKFAREKIAEKHDEVFYGTNFRAADESLPDVKEFNDKFKAKFGKEPDFSASFGYDLVVLMDHLQKTGKDPMESLHEVDLSGLNGPISFDETGESQIQSVMVKVEKGTLTRVE